MATNPTNPADPDVPSTGSEPMSTRQRLVHDLRAAILDGTYPPGARIPSRKSMAADYGVAPMTVAAAYTELAQVGALIVRHGSGTYVADQAAAVLAATPVEQGSHFVGLRLLVSELSETVAALVEEVRALRAEVTALAERVEVPRPRHPDSG